jgi:MoaA/NifB/PqqE/SkfB family radical SAM enzyme
LKDNFEAIDKAFPNSRCHLLEHPNSVSLVQEMKLPFSSIIKYPTNEPFSDKISIDHLSDKSFDHVIVQTSERDFSCPVNLYDFIKTIQTDKHWVCPPSSKIASLEQVTAIRTPKPASATRPFAKEHLKEADEITSKSLFKQFVELVEIEIFSFCNRTCWFCPNSSIDRISTNNFMPEEVYLGILNDLAGINYSGRLSYSRYNEPTADRIILTRLRQAREQLPKVKLYTHTNGDYLDQQYLDDLHNAGLDEIRIQCYFGEKTPYSNEAAFRKIKKKMKKLDIYRDFSLEVLGSKRIRVKTELKELKISLDSMDFHIVGNDRGGSLDTIESKGLPDPCFQPVKSIYVDYNGSMVPCCNIRSDIKAHTRCILGNVEKTNIFEIYGSKKAAAWRNALKDEGEKKLFPCNTCNFR